MATEITHEAMRGLQLNRGKKKVKRKTFAEVDAEDAANGGIDVDNLGQPPLVTPNKSGTRVKRSAPDTPSSEDGTPSMESSFAEFAAAQRLKAEAELESVRANARANELKAEAELENARGKKTEAETRAEESKAQREFLLSMAGVMKDIAKNLNK
jgi:hypothetical protein